MKETMFKLFNLMIFLLCLISSCGEAEAHKKNTELEPNGWLADEMSC